MRKNLVLIESERFWFIALVSKVIDQIHDYLFEHEDGQKETTDIDEKFVDKGSPGHSEVTVEEAEGVTFLDTGLFMLQLVLLVLFGNDYGCNFLEVLVKVDDGDRVNENVDPETRQLVLFAIEPFDLKHPESKLLHAQEPDAKGYSH